MTGFERLLIATTNPGKVAEMRDLLEGLPFNVVAPEEIGLSLNVTETGTTFAENAALKATAWARAAGLLALADDSGLVIDALNGEPGVFSARFGGPHATYPDRFALILARLAEIPTEQRTARFRCAIAVARPDGQIVATSEGTWEGHIADTPRGKHGFGYDPIFYVSALAKTAGELEPAEKHAISHRGQALAAIRVQLRSIAGAADTDRR